MPLTAQQAFAEQEATRTPSVRDQVREHMDLIREHRRKGMPWKNIATALAKLGIRRRSGALITGQSLCQMVGEIERVDDGVRRPVGRPAKISARPMPEVEPLAHPRLEKPVLPTPQTGPMASNPGNSFVTPAGHTPDVDDLLASPFAEATGPARPLDRLQE